MTITEITNAKSCDLVKTFDHRNCDKQSVQHVVTKTKTRDMNIDRTQTPCSASEQTPLRPTGKSSRFDAIAHNILILWLGFAFGFKGPEWAAITAEASVGVARRRLGVTGFD